MQIYAKLFKINEKCYFSVISWPILILFVLSDGAWCGLQNFYTEFRNSLCKFMQISLVSYVNLPEMLYRYLVKNLLRLLIFTLSSYKMDNNKLLTNLKIQEVHMWHRSELENKTPCLAFSRPLAQGQFSALQALWKPCCQLLQVSLIFFLLQIEKEESSCTHSRQIFLIFLCLSLFFTAGNIKSRGCALYTSTAKPDIYF